MCVCLCVCGSTDLLCSLAGEMYLTAGDDIAWVWEEGPRAEPELDRTLSEG